MCGFVTTSHNIIICFQQLKTKLIQVFGKAGGGFHRVHVLPVVYIDTLEFPQKKCENKEEEKQQKYYILMRSH